MIHSAGLNSAEHGGGTCRARSHCRFRIKIPNMLANLVSSGKRRCKATTRSNPRHAADGRGDGVADRAAAGPAHALVLTVL
jgi:hypothetical protein